MLFHEHNIIIYRFFVSPGNGREVLMSHKLLKININGQSIISQIKRLRKSHGKSHLNPYRKIQYNKRILKILFNILCKNCDIGEGECIKTPSKWKWAKREYHVQKKEDVNSADVKISFDPTQFPGLQCFG